MEFCRIEDLHFTDRNKLGGHAVFNVDGVELAAEVNLYLQGTTCLSIRLGRHDKGMKTNDLETYLQTHQQELRKMVSPDVLRLREERRRLICGEDQ